LNDERARASCSTFLLLSSAIDFVLPGIEGGTKNILSSTNTNYYNES